MEDLSAFQRDLLTVIAGMDRPHGLGIKEEIEDYYGEEINHGRLYPNLDTLVKKGLVEKGEADARTNWYSLTQRGARDLASFLEWQKRTIPEQLQPEDFLPASSDIEMEEAPNV